jgi:hypothetical protein
MNVYPPFKNKLENIPEDQQIRVLISFKDLLGREKFIKKFRENRFYSFSFG